MKSKINPIFSIFTTLIIMIIGLIFSSSIYTLYFLAISYILFFLFGMYDKALKMIIVAAIFISIFNLIILLSTYDYNMILRMTIRFLSIFIAIIPSASIYIVDFTTCLNQMKTPRYITLGLMITFSFIPLLTIEMKRIKEAMMTRGITNVLNPKVLYRAFLIPLVIRITNISDTLSMSIEIRGYTNKEKYSIYNPIRIRMKDIIFLCLILILSITLVMVILWLQLN